MNILAYNESSLVGSGQSFLTALGYPFLDKCPLRARDSTEVAGYGPLSVGRVRRPRDFLLLSTICLVFAVVANSGLAIAFKNTEVLFAGVSITTTHFLICSDNYALRLISVCSARGNGQELTLSKRKDHRTLKSMVGS